jgi:hypothetical protein
MALII